MTTTKKRGTFFGLFWLTQSTKLWIERGSLQQLNLCFLKRFINKWKLKNMNRNNTICALTWIWRNFALQSLSFPWCQEKTLSQKNWNKKLWDDCMGSSCTCLLIPFFSNSFCCCYQSQTPWWQVMGVKRISLPAFINRLPDEQLPFYQRRNCQKLQKKSPLADKLAVFYGL